MLDELFSEEEKLNYKPRKKKKDSPSDTPIKSSVSNLFNRTAGSDNNKSPTKKDKKVERMIKDLRYMDDEFLDYAYTMPHLPKMSFARLGQGGVKKDDGKKEEKASKDKDPGEKKEKNDSVFMDLNATQKSVASLHTDFPATTNSASKTNWAMWA
jgi:hypothetical protein